MSKRKTVGAGEGLPEATEREARPPVEAIRAAAFAQFAERGYPVVTVRDIMKACGLTQGACTITSSPRTSCCTTSSPRPRANWSGCVRRRSRGRARIRGRSSRPSCACTWCGIAG